MLKISRGFTLIEVLVAMLVLAIGLLGLAGITVIVLRSNTLSQQTSEATTIASNLMERLIQTTENYQDCTAPLQVAYQDGQCAILEESGVEGTNDANFLPAATNGTADCSIPDILANGVTLNFDRVGTNGQNRADFGPTVNLCDASAAADMPGGLPAGQYIRYYRTIETNPADTIPEFRLISVVLWRDKFGKWRSVRLDTRRTR